MHPDAVDPNTAGPAPVPATADGTASSTRRTIPASRINPAVASGTSCISGATVRLAVVPESRLSCALLNDPPPLIAGTPVRPVLLNWSSPAVSCALRAVFPATYDAIPLTVVSPNGSAAASVTEAIRFPAPIDGSYTNTPADVPPIRTRRARSVPAAWLGATA